MDLFPPIKPTVLIVGDSPVNLSLLVHVLHQSYTVQAANHGEQALQIVREDPPDLILLDVVMPGIDGYEVCRRLKADPLTHQIPIIFLSGNVDISSEQTGMDLGAADYIFRPISPPILLSRVHAHLTLANGAKSLRISNEYLEFEVAKRTQQLLALQDVTILALASLAEARDSDTGNHLRRTQYYMHALGVQLKKNPRFSHFLSADMVDILFKCAPLHDIGKVGIPDKILLKPGNFEPYEFEIMKTHPALGRDAIVRAQKTAGLKIEFLEVAKDIVYAHHEKWDGSGYPLGLAGDEIPIPARLMALADVYDALISRRIYKPSMGHEKAVQTIVQGRCQHFDPDVVDAFLAVEGEFRAIASRFVDSDEDLQRKADYVAQAL